MTPGNDKHVRGTQALLLLGLLGTLYVNLLVGSFSVYIYCNKEVSVTLRFVCINICDTRNT